MLEWCHCIFCISQRWQLLKHQILKSILSFCRSTGSWTRMLTYRFAHYAISGADITGSFLGKGKLAGWKTFQKADEDIINQLVRLGETETPTAETKAAIEKFVCQLYIPKTTMTEVKELRWWLFRKKLAQSERLPPTSAALNKAILPAHYQAMVWNNDRVASPHLLSPQSYGWERKGDE